MVITRIKNRSPDMILTAFDGKFDEKKDELPPGICRPPYASKYSIFVVNLRVDIKHKNGHKWAPGGSPWVRIWHVPTYHTVKDFVTPKGPQF